MSITGDIRLSLRTLANNRGFTIVAVSMLALGIGVNATVFTVTNAVLFKGFPLVVRNDRLLYISNGGCCISYPDFEDIRDQAKSFTGMGITHGLGKVVSDETGYPEHVEVTEVSAATFQTVGVKPFMGRDFSHADELPGAPAVAVLNYGFWERRYAKDLAILGQTIRLNGAPTTVIGVMPAGFSFPQTVDTWVPLVITDQVKDRDRTNTWFAFGRIADGVTFETARTEVAGIIKRLEIAYPVTDRRNHLLAQHFYEFFIGSNAVALYGSMWGAVLFVLLIACATLANLLLARAMGRSREIAIRMALGAGRWRVIRQLLVESVLLSGFGGFLGWQLARWGVRAYALAMANKESWLIIDYTMDRTVMFYVIAVSVGTGILFGLAPALRLSKLDVHSMLKDGGRSSTGGGHARYLSALLVSGEMALAVVLLAGAGVMIRSFLKIHSANMGVNISNVLCASVDLPATKYSEPEQRISFFDRLTAGLEAKPGVDSVALAESLPSWGSPRYPYDLQGSPSSGKRPTMSALKVSPSYFHAVQARMISGREFNDGDGPSALPVAIVNQLLADKYWPGEDPLGKRFRLFRENTPGPWLTVVGVVSNIVQNDQNRQRFDPVAYLPYRQAPGGGMWILLRAHVPPASLAGAVRREVQTLDADLPLYGPFLVTDRLERFWDSRFYGMLFLIFAGIALLLASIGLYSVVAHSVRRQTQEIGVRMAVGASAGDVLKLVLRQGMPPLATGLMLGLAGAVAVNRILKSTLIGVSPWDPLTLLGAAGLLILAAALGCLIPARRALRVDPAIALRQE